MLDPADDRPAALAPGRDGRDAPTDA